MGSTGGYIMVLGFIRNLGFTEILVIMGIALLVFGPAKLPEIGRSIGKSINEFKKSMNDDSAKKESEKPSTSVDEDVK